MPYGKRHKAKKKKKKEERRRKWPGRRPSMAPMAFFLL
jgi:hypothetical protein